MGGKNALEGMVGEYSDCKGANSRQIHLNLRRRKFPHYHRQPLER